MANSEHLAKLKEGVEAWNKWRKENQRVKPDLKQANLSGANLSGANLSEANLSEANLSWAKLIEAFLLEANLTRANLNGANLNGANLNGANLNGAILSEANLSEANLTAIYLGHAIIDDKQEQLFLSKRVPLEDVIVKPHEGKPGHKAASPYQVQPLELLIQPGTATAKEIGQLLAEISRLYRMLGGSGINFTVVDSREPAVAYVH